MIKRSLAFHLSTLSHWGIICWYIVVVSTLLSSIHPYSILVPFFYLRPTFIYLNPPLLFIPFFGSSYTLTYSFSIFFHSHPTFIHSPLLRFRFYFSPYNSLSLISHLAQTLFLIHLLSLFYLSLPLSLRNIVHPFPSPYTPPPSPSLSYTQTHSHIGGKSSSRGKLARSRWRLHPFDGVLANDSRRSCSLSAALRRRRRVYTPAHQQRRRRRWHQRKYTQRDREGQRDGGARAWFAPNDVFYRFERRAAAATAAVSAIFPLRGIRSGALAARSFGYLSPPRAPKRRRSYRAATYTRGRARASADRFSPSESESTLALSSYVRVCASEREVAAAAAAAVAALYRCLCVPVLARETREPPSERRDRNDVVVARPSPSLAARSRVCAVPHDGDPRRRGEHTAVVYTPSALTLSERAPCEREREKNVPEVELTSRPQIDR